VSVVEAARRRRGLQVSVREAVAQVRAGTSLCLSKHAPIRLIMELIRSGKVSGLDMVGVPTAGLGMELLVGAGLVRSIETGAILMEDGGRAPSVDRALKAGTVSRVESACPLIELALQAGASGLPFTVVPGIMGSDVVASRPEARVIPDVYEDGREVVVVPAMRPDVFMAHARRADRWGNVVVGIGADDRLATQAARRVLYSVEEIVVGEIDRIAADEQVIPALYIDGVVRIEGGAAPLSCRGYYKRSGAAFDAYRSIVDHCGWEFGAIEAALGVRSVEPGSERDSGRELSNDG
jgi:glutaconate CoA-transferase subunit A